MKLNGRFQPPGDKSVSHRVALFSLLAEGTCRVFGYSTCEDCQTTLKAVQALADGVKHDGDAIILTGAGGQLKREAVIDCGNSGTTMRLLTGLLSGQAGTYRLDGDESLRRRPMERVALPMRLMGADVKTVDGKPPMTILGGDLHSIDYAMPVASAQLKSALLLAGLQAEGETALTEPAPSRDHTERMFRAWGAPVKTSRRGVSVSRGSLNLPPSFHVPADVSGAAFFVCGAILAVGSEVTAEHVLLNPSRIGWIDVLRRMGADVEVVVEGEEPEPVGIITARATPQLTKCEVSAAEIPNIVDEVPILSLLATQAAGITVFRNAGELRVKESDRLMAMVTELRKLGADIRVDGDDLFVRGRTPLRAPEGPLESYGDHRVAMALRIASLIIPGEILIRDEACAAVSYPNFAETFAALTGSGSAPADQ